MNMWGRVSDTSMSFLWSLCTSLIRLAYEGTGIALCRAFKFVNLMFQSQRSMYLTTKPSNFSLGFRLVRLLYSKCRGAEISRIPCTYNPIYIRLVNANEKQTAVASGQKHGCLPPPQLPNQWPLGIDWIRKLWRLDSGQHLLAFLCSVAGGYEPRNNLCQYLPFGPRAFHVLDPKNLEDVLSTSFQGSSLRCHASSHETKIDVYII